jgi:hypothetical protein
MEACGVVRVLFSTTSGRLLDEPIFAEGAQLLAAEIAALPHVAECLTVLEELAATRGLNDRG